MKGFEEIMSIGSMNLKGLVIEESPNLLLIKEKKKVYVPERKIILMGQVPEQKSRFLMSVTNNKGVLIV